MNVGWMFQSDEVGCFDVSQAPGSGGFVLHDDTQIISNAGNIQVLNSAV